MRSFDISIHPQVADDDIDAAKYDITYMMTQLSKL